MSLLPPIDRIMLIPLRRQYAQLITSGSQVFLLLIGAQFHNAMAWLWCLSGMALISLAAWYSTLQRWRAISGTPTSKVASAAQGYVELVGKGGNLDDTPVISKLTSLPCLWYRYKIERKTHKNEWRTESSGESEAAFLLDDGSATCIIDPAGAEIITQYQDTWVKGEYRYTEWKLLNIDTVYAIGEFRTVGGSTDARTSSDEVGTILAEWKQDMPELHRRFDLDQDGELNLREWELARRAAQREAEKRLEKARSAPDQHYLFRPSDGRLYLISNLTPARLARRYVVWTWLHMLIFVGALAGIAWLL